jgi:hypothetical protein
VESKWKYYHITAFPGESLSENRGTHARCFLWRQNRNTWKVLKCGAGGGWKRSVGLIM